MESYTPIEALNYNHLTLKEAVESAEQSAVTCEIARLTALRAMRETRLSLIRYQQDLNQLNYTPKNHDRKESPHRKEKF